MSQVIVLTQDQLNEMLENVVSKVETIIKNSQRKEVTSKEWLTANEVCAILKISQTTLHDWSNKGIIIKHRIGDRIRFRHDEIQESLLRMEAKRQRV
ncbi:MAG: helix-turn-helix domain-containing protein [Saprospiraceae bacterium]|nr:helix-turn-helix domain-containing protein [Candidatus Vicinibacter affinis]